MAKRKDDKSMISDLQEELTEQGRNIWWAGLGALATVEEEGSKIFNQFVERGKNFEDRRRKELESLLERARKESQDAAHSAAETAGGAVEAGSRAQKSLMQAVTDTMDRLGVPTQSRVDTLSTQVEQLSKRVEEMTRLLDQQREGRPERGTMTTYRVEPHDNEGWRVIKEGNERATSVHDRKQEAVEAGREVAQQHAPSTLVIYKQDGTIQEDVSYEMSE